MRGRASRLAAVCGIGLALAACNGGDTNFSQYPGFSAHFAANPPTTTPASAAERELLTRYRPRFYLPPGHAGLISFYDDYIAQGYLQGGDRNRIADKVDRALLNRHKNDPRVVFVHEPETRPARPVVFGRVDRVTAPFPADDGVRSESLTFLTYHAVFRHSGLPAGVPAWQAAALGMVADLDDWHQLDHYTAASLVLGLDDEPLALMLQQHNYQRTYLFGAELPLPADGRVGIDIAIRSNELYPHDPERRRRPAVRFPEPASVRYLMGFGEAPMDSADDITHGAVEADYELAFLPPDDAFYTFKGFLGERRSLPGRDGPPGADYNTLPDLKPLERQLTVSYWRAGNAGDLARFETALTSDGWYLAFARAQAAVFWRNWQCLRELVQACRLD